MTPTRITAPSFPALSTTQLREWLRLDDDVDQLTLDMLLGSAVDYIEGVTGKILVSADYEIDKFCPDRIIEINMNPVNSVSIAGSYAIVDEDSTVDDIIDDIPESVWEWDAERNQIRFLECELPRVISITVNAGYDNEASIPDGLRHALAVLVGASYDGRNELSEATVKTVSRLVARHRRLPL